MTVHFLAHFNVTDADKYHVYEKGFFPILKKHGGTFLTFDDNPKVLEGEHEPGRMVLIEFESEEAFQGWWDDPEYVELAKHRHAGTSSYSIVMLHPVPGR